VPQFVTIVEVLVAEREAEHPLADQRAHRVLDQLEAAAILQARGHSCQCATKPPSTGKATPSTMLAPGLHSQSTAAATSSGRPARPIGCSFKNSFMAAGSMLSPIGVSMQPGHTALIRM
jgi:hypothetical protein